MGARVVANAPLLGTSGGGYGEVGARSVGEDARPDDGYVGEAVDD